jgi:hypothetical protein
VLLAVSESFDVHISPEPSDDDRQAILAAVRQTLEQEAEHARPSAWRLAGWVGQRAGIRDMDRWIAPGRRWTLSMWMPRGGRPFNGLNGRGDAK